VLLTWRIGRRLYGPPPGPHGRDRHEPLVGNALYVRRASTDQLFVFCLALAMYGFSATPSGRIAAEPRFLLFTWARRSRCGPSRVCDWTRYRALARDRSARMRRRWPLGSVGYRWFASGMDPSMSPRSASPAGAECGGRATGRASSGARTLRIALASFEPLTRRRAPRFRSHGRLTWDLPSVS
jgi:hypothetical protein